MRSSSSSFLFLRLFGQQQHQLAPTLFFRGGGGGEADEEEEKKKKNEELAALRYSWDGDFAADQRSREVVKELIRQDAGVYTDAEKMWFELALRTEQKVESGAAQIKVFKAARRVGHRSQMQQASTAYVDQVLIGHVECLIRAPVLEVLAFFMDNDSFALNKYASSASTKERRTLEVVNSHRTILYGRFSSSPFSDREFVGNCMWRKEAEGQYLIVNVPGEHRMAPLDPHVVRGESVRVHRLKEVSSSVTKYKLTFTMDLRGNLPKAITNNVVIPGNFSSIADYQRYFQLIKPSFEFSKDGEDVAMLAHLIMDDFFSQVTSAQREAELRKYFIRAASLREITGQYPWFYFLILHILRNKVRPLASCKVPLESFSEANAKTVGGALALALLSSTTGEMAVDDWIISCPALTELASAVPWFRPFVTCFAKRLLGQSSWGKTARVCGGAAISILDMITDIIMIDQYFTAGHVKAAWATIGMISLTLTVQLLVVTIQYKRKSPSVVVREMALVASCLKPAVDAYRLLGERDPDPLLMVEPMREIMYMKCVEVALESIGGSVLQTVVFVKSPKMWTPVAFLSLAMSAFSMSYSVTTVTYDMDASPLRRRLQKKFYGMIPDQGRGLTFFLMLLLSLWQVAAKVFAVALLSTASTTWCILWITADVALFLLFKFLRRDFVYHVPGLAGAKKYFVSLVVRVVTKVLVDFTGILHLRLPSEMGCLYFSFSMLGSQLSCWIAAYLYNKHYDGNNKIDLTTIYTFIGVVQGLWATTSISFFVNIKRSHWSTFYTTTSGHQQTKSYFLDNVDDEAKMSIFKRHEDQWSDIKEQVKLHTYQNWSKWALEKPKWFDDQFRARVPDEFVPIAFKLELCRGGTRGELDSRTKSNAIEKSKAGATVVPEPITGYS